MNKFHSIVLSGGDGGGLELDGGKSVVGSTKSRLSARSKGGDLSAGAGMSAGGDDPLDVAGLDGLRCAMQFLLLTSAQFKSTSG